MFQQHLFSSTTFLQCIHLFTWRETQQEDADLKGHMQPPALEPHAVTPKLKLTLNRKYIQQGCVPHHALPGPPAHSTLHTRLWPAHAAA